MSDPIWYVYQNSKQTGPFEKERVLNMLDTNMIAQNAYLFKAGWKDWCPLEDCLAELGRGRGQEQPPTPGSSPRIRKERSPRATIKGRIIVHNNGQLVIGGGVNISSSGIFVETPDPLFKIGEKLKLTCRVDGFVKAFNVVAVVMRFNEDKKFPVGYGMKFEALDKKIAKEIQILIDQSNEILNQQIATK